MRTSLIMMAGKLPKNAMNLKQFMMHQEVIKLYRNFMRSIKQIPDEADRQSFKEWVRSDFKKNKDITDEHVIKTLYMNGQRALKELQQSLELSHNSLT